MRTTPPPHLPHTALSHPLHTHHSLSHSTHTTLSLHTHHSLTHSTLTTRSPTPHTLLPPHTHTTLSLHTHHSLTHSTHTTLSPTPHTPLSHLLQILTKYLTEVDDIELRLQLATEVGVFDVGLDCLKALKDKEKLRSYINCIPTNKHWDYRPKIDALLANSVSSVDDTVQHLFIIFPSANQMEIVNKIRLL